MSQASSPFQRAFDPVAAAHVLQRLSCQPQPPWLHTEVAGRMAQRLSLIRLQPARLFEWWPTWGGGRNLLVQAYPRAQLVGVEPTTTRLAQAQAQARAQQPPWWQVGHWTQPTPQWVLDAGVDAVPPAQLVWSNMMLHAVADPLALFARWHQLLSVDGFVMFSCLGPGSLAELRQLYATQGWKAAHADFVDMHDLGDMLVQVGFCDPVMDQETLTLTWAHPASLLAELRQWGGNVSPARFSGLRTPRWRQQFLSAWQGRANAAGRMSLSVEVVYGHAFKAAPRVPVSSETTFSVDTLRQMARQPRSQKGL